MFSSFNNNAGERRGSSSHGQQRPRRPSFTTHNAQNQNPLFDSSYSPGSMGTPTRDPRLIRSKSSPSPAQDYLDDELRRDSHDLSLGPRFERDSLVDNLLLSFDKFDRLGDGSLGFDRNFFGSGFEDNIPDNASIGGASSHRTHTRGRRSNSSSNYHSHLRRPSGLGIGGGSLGGGLLESRGRYGSVDYGDEEVPGFGVTYGRRDTASRRGLSSAGTGASGYLEYDDAAPTPTIYSGPRDRTMTITGQQQTSGTLSRKPSNKSMKSLKRLANSDSNPFSSNSIPPMPAFVSSAPPPSKQQSAPTAQAVTPKPSKPGFFRSLFGGGSSNSAKQERQQSIASTGSAAGGGVGSMGSPQSRNGVGQTTSGTRGRAFEEETDLSFREVDTGRTRSGSYNPNSVITVTSTTVTTVETVNRNDDQSTYNMGNSQSGNGYPQPPTTAAGDGGTVEPSQPHNTSGASPYPTIKQKSSFFRRRKKSVSDASVQQSHLTLPQANQIQNVDKPEPSPASSLRAVMSPYLRAPVRSPNKEGFSTSMPESSGYLQKDATIRTVANSDSESPHNRPTFFTDSERRGSTTSGFGGFGRKKEQKYSAKAAESTVSLAPQGSRYASGENGKERPQTSPHAPGQSVGDRDDDVPDMPTSIPSKFRSGSVDEEKDTLKRLDPSWNPGYNPSQVIRERPIMTVEELEKHHEREMKRRASENLVIDSSVGGIDSQDPDKSWLATPTPMSAVSTPTVTLQKEGGTAETISDEDSNSDISVDAVIPSEAEREKARKIYDGDEEVVAKDKAAHVLAESGFAGERLRKAYMECFDWKGMNILVAMRQLCNRLILKGESQEMDRLIDAFSKRWCDCNANHGFKSVDVVHTIIYSLLLLNTDLHIADLTHSQRMTRGQFLKNTMATIRRGLQDANIPTPLDRPSTNNFPPPKSQTPYRRNSDDITGKGTTRSASDIPSSNKRPSIDYGRNTKNSSRSSNIGGLPSPRLFPESDRVEYENDGGNALVNKPIGGGIRIWETQVEVILKDFYTSLKEEALPLHGFTPLPKESNSNNLSIFGGGMLRRSPSTISKAGSEHSHSSGRRTNPNQMLTSKWATKNRSRPRLYNGSYAGSSRTSLEERSLWSPTGSSTWSKLSLDHTKASTMSVDSLHSTFGIGDFHQSIGFANALSHAIIREEGSGVGDGDDEVFDDEELELAGPPWAKEGMLKHKHHLENVDKKAKNREWTECFAVIERGYVKMFRFSGRSGAASNAASGVVGGGNWSENADQIGSFLLRQTLASALPPPGYSKARPHVWALSLPTGAVHLFQAGTAEIVEEWVTTANYWSARLSKEPLVGGVSNIEYGWGDLVLAEQDNASTFGGNGPRPSLQESVRSSIDHIGVRPKLPGDKIVISDWTPPPPSMMSSSLNESDQLKALTTYVSNIEAELTKHNDLRSAMILAFSPRHPNSQKALNNWEKKSSYLLHEIVKFRTYIDSLQMAAAQREKMRAEKAASLRSGSRCGDDASIMTGLERAESETVL